MSKLPVLKPREVCRILENFGLTMVRQRGSHMLFRRPDDGEPPFRIIRDISPILLRQIARDIGLTAEELIGNR
jgi:predicted RNA binding protein YcfA (HicA-like mRNA interferase family)